MADTATVTVSGESKTSGESCDPQPPDDQPEQIRLVLLGKTGAGKSASGNTILGKNVFDSKKSSSSQTRKCEAESTVRGGKEIVVVDTPGLFDTEISEQETKKQIIRCITDLFPGPHAFLMVISLNARFNKEEKQAVEKLSEIFGKDTEKYMLPLFTHKDSLDKQTIAEYIDSGSSDLKNLLKKCGGRFCSLNNKSSEYKDFKELMRKVETMITENEKRFYTTGILQEVQKEFKEKQDKTFEEKIKKYEQERPKMDETEWQKINRKLVEEAEHEAKQEILSVLEQYIASGERESAGQHRWIQKALEAVEKLSKEKMCSIL